MITATYNSSENNLSIYVDSVYGGSTSHSTNPGDLTIDLGVMAEYYDNALNGTIDEIYISNRSLSQSEISELWADGAGNQYPFVVDTCTCPGAGNNWEIDMSDYCNITDDCNLTTGNITFIGEGITRFNATISCLNLEHPSTNQTLYIDSNCLTYKN